jgi:hypothetical protein
MFAFLKNLATGVARPSRQRAAARPKRRTCLNVEMLEERLALSSSPLGGSSLLAPPVAAPMAQTASGIGVILPDRPVHGYKWRRPPWYPWDGSAPGSTPAQTIADLDRAAAVVQHLVAGGADGTNVMMAANGHVTVQPHEGPAPTEFLGVRN